MIDAGGFELSYRTVRKTSGDSMMKIKTIDIFQRHYRVMTSKNGADVVHLVAPAQAPASQDGQRRAQSE